MEQEQTTEGGTQRQAQTITTRRLDAKEKGLVLALCLLGMAAAFFVGSKKAPAKEKPQALCQQTPSWQVRNPAGQELGIYVCFDAQDNLLRYAVRVLPPPAAVPAPPAAPLVPAAPAAAKHPAKK